MSINSSAVNSISSDPAVRAKLEELANQILTEAKANIVAMGAVDTGELLNSGTVEISGDTFTVRFTAPHGEFVHEGEGTNDGYGPRPFLASSALKYRGAL